VPAVSDVLAAFERRDWDRLARLLDPSVHWTTAAEEELDGRAPAIARISRDPPPAPPAYHALREGRIVRWIDVAG